MPVAPLNFTTRKSTLKTKWNFHQWYPFASSRPASQGFRTAGIHEARNAGLLFGQQSQHKHLWCKLPSPHHRSLRRREKSLRGGFEFENGLNLRMKQHPVNHRNRSLHLPNIASVLSSK